MLLGGLIALFQDGHFTRLAAASTSALLGGLAAALLGTVPPGLGLWPDAADPGAATDPHAASIAVSISTPAGIASWAASLARSSGVCAWLLRL
jgi:hypothetical protein